MRTYAQPSIAAARAGMPCLGPKIAMSGLWPVTILKCLPYIEIGENVEHQTPMQVPLFQSVSSSYLL